MRTGAGHNISIGTGVTQDSSGPIYRSGTRLDSDSGGACLLGRNLDPLDDFRGTLLGTNRPSYMKQNFVSCANKEEVLFWVYI